MANSELQQMVSAFHDGCMKWSMGINTDNTKILSNGAEEANISIADCFKRMFLNFAIWAAL